MKPPVTACKLLPILFVITHLFCFAAKPIKLRENMSVHLNKSTATVDLYFNVKKYTTLKISVLNSEGMLQAQFNQQASKGLNKFQIAPIDSLKEGQYKINIKNTKSGKEYTCVFVLFR